MTITFVAAGTHSATDGTSSSPNPGLPAGLANDDILILQAEVRGTGATIPAPSGYTEIATVNRTSSHRLSIFRKHVTNAGTETAPTVTATVSGLISCRLTAWRGCDTTTPLDVDPVTGTEDGADTTGTAPEITTASAGAMVLWCWSTPDDNTVTAATGTTAYSSDTTTGADGNIGIAYLLEASAIGSGTNVLTQTVNGPDNWNFVTLALRPSAVATADPTTTTHFGFKYGVYAAFGASVFASNPTETDISAYVRHAQGIGTARGRNDEFSDVSPGTCSFTLDNRTRRFDPDYTSGPYYGQLVPMVRIRVAIRIGSTNYNVYTGYVQAWDQTYDVSNREATCTINCVDLLSILSRTELPPTLLGLKILGDRPAGYWPMNETGRGGTMADASGNGLDGTYNYYPQVDSATGCTPIDSFLPAERSYQSHLIREPTSGTYLGLAFSAPGSARLNLAHTVEVWVQMAPMSEGNAVVLFASTNAMFELRFEPAGGGVVGTTLTVNLYDEASTTVTAAVPVPNRAPAHFAVTIDSTLTTLTVYRNGAVARTVDISSLVFDGGSFDRSVVSCDSVGQSYVYIAHMAVYDYELSATQISEHFDAGMTGGYGQLASDRLQDLADFVGITDAGLYSGTAMGTDTYLAAATLADNVLSEIQKINQTEQGRIFVSPAGVLTAQGRVADMGGVTVNSVSQATLADSGTYAYVNLVPSPATLDLIRNTISVTVAGVTSTVQDNSSRALYGSLPESIDSVLASAEIGRNLGLSRLRRFATPSTRFTSLDLIAKNTSDVRLILALTLELGTRLTVTRTPQGAGNQVSKVVAVEGISHSFTGVTWTTTLYLAPAQQVATDRPWFIISASADESLISATRNFIHY